MNLKTIPMMGVVRTDVLRLNRDGKSRTPRRLLPSEILSQQVSLLDNQGLF
jgi:hypothetical protein